jgi:hypothetical protein
VIKIKIILSFLLTICFLSGCAAVTIKSIPLSKENRKLIKTVYIDPEIKQPQEISIITRGYEAGSHFGLVGFFISESVSRRPVLDSIHKIVDKNNIDIKKIIYQKWLNQIKNKTNFKISNQLSDTSLMTEISAYGIRDESVFSENYIPILAVNSKLIRNKQTIWQQTMYITGNGRVEKYKIDEILTDPRKLYSMWDVAADEIVIGMLDDMKKL